MYQDEHCISTERIEEIEKGLSKLQKERENEIGVKSMEGGREGTGSKGAKNLDSNSVRGGSNRVGGGSSYRGSALSMEGISMHI